MGYTHYWDNNNKITAEEFKSFAADCNTLIAKSMVDIFDGWGDKEFTPKTTEVTLNGDASRNLDHETFCLSLNPSSDYCKTNNKPYDEVVTAILLRAYEVGIVTDVSSDGFYYEWVKGLELYRSVFGTYPDKFPALLPDWDYLQRIGLVQNIRKKAALATNNEQFAYFISKLGAGGLLGTNLK